MYRHYKGDMYLVTGYIFLSDTEEYGVTYSLYATATAGHADRFGKLCARSVREWTEVLRRVHEPSVQRYEYLKEVPLGENHGKNHRG